MLSNIEKTLISKEETFCSNTYHPLPVVLKKGKGVFVWDVNNKKYFDYLSAYSAVNQGHCNKQILNTFIKQAKKLTLTSRAFYNNELGSSLEYITSVFGYEKMLPMNSGAEAVETAIKISRKWGYEVKKVQHNKAKIIVCNGNFHGRTTTVVSFSSHHESRENFGPLTGGFETINYNDSVSLEKKLKIDKNIVGFLVEPIQGEGGVVVPDDGYLTSCKKLCEKYNVLFIADEIQTGVCRTGELLACPFGGNPLGCVVAKEAIKFAIENSLSEKAHKLGLIFRNYLIDQINNLSIVKSVRGKGLLNAIVLNCDVNSEIPWNICLSMRDNGLLAKPTQGNKIRFAPPLVITEKQLFSSLKIITKSLKNF